ncbi:MAG: ABC transporter ATP-binding protein [Fibrobacter sp.]|nr:ABC transporter ATP-binding protein [Fibrobacter sp.]
MHPISNSKAFQFLLHYLKKHTGSILIGMVFLIGVDSVLLIIPKIIEKALDVLGNDPYSGGVILKMVLTIIALAVSSVLLRFLWRYFVVRPSRKIEMSLREDMFAHLESLSSSYFNKTKTGDLMALFINDINAIRMACGMALVGMIDSLFLSSMSLFFMFSISPQLALYTIIPLPLIILLLVKTGKLVQTRHIRVQECFDAISSHTQEAISGIRLIKGFHQECNEIEKFIVHCDKYVSSNIKLIKLWGILFPTITLLGSLSFAILIFFGGRLVIFQKISIGQFVSFTFYINLIIWPMIAIGWVFNMFQRGLASAGRVKGMMDIRPEIIVDGKSIAPVEIHGKIEFRSLTFRYSTDSPDILKKINLTIPAGTSLGIIGKPGSGKTTLASLLFHLYPVSENCIFIDGHDINSVPLIKLRNSISYVPQDSSLFSDTIKENIAFGLNREISQEELEDVARKASIHNDILGFTDGYQTIIGERGITLSGGQKQRIAIARALLIDAPVLILDDALSAVDTSTERRIWNAIKEDIQKRTSIVIAHRISTVKNCTNIIVLDNGIITEHGTHEQLVAKGGFYSRLDRLQQMGEPVL